MFFSAFNRRLPLPGNPVPSTAAFPSLKGDKSFVNCKSRDFGSIIEYKCVLPPGFQFDDDASTSKNVTCLAHGSWSHQVIEECFVCKLLQLSYFCVLNIFFDTDKLCSGQPPKPPRGGLRVAYNDAVMRYRCPLGMGFSPLSSSGIEASQPPLSEVQAFCRGDGVWTTMNYECQRK